MNAFEVLNISPTANRDEIRQAYRMMARRWHPDRFMAGPERDWANEKMAAINSAYRTCLDGLKDARIGEAGESEVLAQAGTLIEDGCYDAARRKLMSLNTRCAEWNYLFGGLLVKMGDLDKALIYLSVATHQNPDSQKYAAALADAERMVDTSWRSRVFAWLK